jgi:hypothetical protein
MPFMYNNPLFSLNLPSNSALSFSELELSNLENSNSNFSLTYISPFCPIIKIRKKKYYQDNIKKFNYFDKGKKLKKINI